LALQIERSLLHAEGMLIVEVVEGAGGSARTGDLVATFVDQLTPCLARLIVALEQLGRNLDGLGLDTFVFERAVCASPWASDKEPDENCP